jgi:hyperosmotically inducible periplasmic protein
MSLRIAMLLSLSGLAACSNTTSEPAREPNDVDVASASDADLRPASFDDRSASATDSNAPTARDATAAPASGVLGPDVTRDGDSAARAGAPANAPANTGSSTTATTPSGSPPGAPGTQPDNTKVNERDRNAAAQTPMDQGNNATDLKITQQIRQAVMGNDALSFTAKNVKIITNGGKVTLRGPVKTAAERDAIDAAARKVAGAQVDNQIEVKK